MYNKQIFVILLLISTMCFSQSTTTKITHLNNVYSIKLEENDNHSFDLFITNETNDGASVKKVITNKTTEAEFEKMILGSLDGLTENYVFKNNVIDTLLIEPNEVTGYTYDSFIKNIKPNKIGLLKAFKEKIEYTNYKDFIKDKITLGNNPLFNGLKITLKLIDSKNSYALVYLDELEKVFTNENEFETEFYDLAIVHRLLLKPFYTEENLKALINIQLSSENSGSIADLFKNTIANDEYVLLGNYTAENSKNTYELSIKQELDKNYFLLRICSSNTSKCNYTIKLDLKIEPSDFKEAVLSKINSLVDKEKLSDNDIDDLYVKCITSNEKEVVKKANAPLQKKLENIIQQIEDEKTTYSGVLKLKRRLL